MKLNFPWQKIQAVNAGKEFAALRLWEQFDNMDFFVVETPLEEPVVVCIMGAGMQEFGLCVFRGPDAFEQPFHSFDLTYSWYPRDEIILQAKLRNLLDETIEIEREGVTTFEEKPGMGVAVSFEWLM